MLAVHNLVRYENTLISSEKVLICPMSRNLTRGQDRIWSHVTVCTGAPLTFVPYFFRTTRTHSHAARPKVQQVVSRAPPPLRELPGTRRKTRETERWRPPACPRRARGTGLQVCSSASAGPGPGRGESPVPSCTHKPRVRASPGAAGRTTRAPGRPRGGRLPKRCVVGIPPQLGGRQLCAAW